MSESSASPQVPKSATTNHGAILDDIERDPDISMPAQASTTLRSSSIDHSPGDGDEGYSPGIALSSNAPAAPHTTPTLHSSRDRDSRSGEDSRTGVSIRPATLDYSSQKAKTVAHTDGDMGSEEAPSISLLQGSSNFQIHNTTFNAIGGNATLVRFGDGQFTEIQRNLICDYIANLTVLPDIKDNLKKHVLTQSIISLPRAKAVFDDYRNKKKSGHCFKGTREALLREMADWATSSSESRMYILSGLAGIGKSTVAYTIASRAADLNLLGASFFFSRDEADRKNAEFFFSTIAYQLCVYSETFSKAIGDVLLTERGSAATTKDPEDQLRALILEPLRNTVVQSRSLPILIVVDALDECDEEDAFSVLVGLSQLVRELPSFKVILTTRPQLHLDRFLHSQSGHKIFRLQDIEDKVVDGDIRLYLNYSLSLEQVHQRYPQRQWCPSDGEIDSLVHAAGRLFIIASTAVRYIFDKSASNPEAQMQKLIHAYLTPFRDLDRFYTIILRNVVPENCDNDCTVRRYQSVVGAIIFVQRPLSVSTLAHLINIDVLEIREVLDNLQSVILLGSDDVPHVYHRSFPDYLTDQARCKDLCLRIDTRTRHTQIATYCFGIMGKHLKRNILGLGDPARFMSNEDSLREEGITNEQLEEKIPQQLRYACVYWANHLEIAKIEDADLMNELERFVDEHTLHWFEVLSLIGKLDSANHSIGVALKLLKSRSSDLHQLLSDASRFNGKFYELIKRSALHTYCSALSFTPTNSHLYRRYKEEIRHSICSIEGGPEKWDALVADMSHGEPVDIIKFSLASDLFVSCSQGKSKIWYAATGIPISTIPGQMFAVANDFSTVASSQDNITMLYNVNGSPGDTVFAPSSKIHKLALSSESRRVAAALSDGTVWLWDSRNAESTINKFDGFKGSKYWSRLEFSPTGTRLAYSSVNGIKLRDGISGKAIAHLQCGSGHKFEFSGDGSRIASLSRDDSLKLWNSESGGLIGDAKVVGWHCLAISANGFLLATADYWGFVTLWSEYYGSVAQVDVLETGFTRSMTFSSDKTRVLAIATDSDIKLYNVETRSVIRTLPLGGTPLKLAFSPDCTRLAVADYDGKVNLWDIRGIESIDASRPPSKEKISAVTALAFSRDCSRLACGYWDGTVEMLETGSTKGQIGPLAFGSETEAIRIYRQYLHSEWIRVLEFDPDGQLFAAGSGGTIKLWNVGDGALRGTLKAPGWLQAVALSNSVLVATWGGWDSGVTLWSLDTLNRIHTFDGRFHDRAFKVSIADNSALIAVYFRHSHVALLDALNHTTIATFDVIFDIHTMTSLPDNSQLVVQSDEGASLSFNLVNELVIEGPELGHTQLPNTPLWHGIPIWHCKNKEQHCVLASFSPHKSSVPILWIPKDLHMTAWTQGSSTIALGCKDGRIILLRPPTSTCHDS